MVARRHYAPEFKVEAVTLVQGEYTVHMVAEQLGIPEGTLWNWVHGRGRQGVESAQVVVPTGSGGDEPVDPATYRAAVRRIAELERENEFLGKASAYVAQKVHP